MSVQLLRRQFTVEEYRKMAEVGILPEDDKVELLRGEIVEMPPSDKRNAAHLKNRLNRLFSERLGDRVLVSIQDPFKLDDSSEPLPDLSLLQPRVDFSESRHPQPEDIFLLVKVADPTV